MRASARRRWRAFGAPAPAGGALPVALVGALSSAWCVSHVVSPAEVRAPSSHSLVLAADAARPCRDGGFASSGGDGCYAGRPGLPTRGDLVHGGWALCAVRRLRRACAGLDVVLGRFAPCRCPARCPARSSFRGSGSSVLRTSCQVTLPLSRGA